MNQACTRARVTQPSPHICTILTSFAVVSLQGDEAGDRARGEQHFKTYDQIDQREGNRHSAINFNGRHGDAEGDARARARNQLAGDRDGYHTSIRRFEDESGESCSCRYREEVRARAGDEGGPCPQPPQPQDVECPNVYRIVFGVVVVIVLNSVVIFR